ncbi:TPA: MarR family transcriptional regulator [Escherichia coli]|nr:MarR family transcriptional regulator [Escherichia coli]
MSMHLMNEAWKVKLNSTIQKLVLMALAEKADNKRRTHVSREEVAAMCELPVHTVHDAFVALTHKGFICRPDAFSDVYVLMLPEE